MATVSLLMLVGCAGSSDEPVTGTSNRTLSLEGRDRTYQLYVGKGADGRRPLPLVLAMHGRGQTGTALAGGIQYNAQADQHGFLVAYPQGWRKEWNTRLTAPTPAVPDDVAFLTSIIDDVARVHPVDRRRVYATGHSDGGRMAFRLACERAEVFAAVAPMAGGLTVGCRPSRPISVLQVEGADDTLTFQEAAGAVLELRKKNGCPQRPKVERVGLATVTRYLPCRDGVEVAAAIVPGVGHPVWSLAPNGYDATVESWKFFSRFSLPAAAG